MAYNKAFNPDALPAHAEPEQAAAALSHLRANQRQQSPNQRQQSPNQRPPNQPPPGGRRPSSPSTGRAALPSQSYRPPPQGYNPQHSNNSQPYGSNSYASRIHSPPPPTNYGHSQRPPADPAAIRRPSNEASQYPPPTPAPVDPDSVDLFPLFRAANVSGTGSLTTSELGSALVNADFTPFDRRTIDSLMRMFSTSPGGQPQGPTITYTEFENLWRFLAAWRTLFERFDEDGSGRISLPEFSKALVAFGYRLSQPFVGVLYHTFNDRGGAANRGMSFDLFVQACISLKRMTDVFKKYDDDRDGYVTLSFEEFLTEIIRLRD